jgi:hypothetical protein
MPPAEFEPAIPANERSHTHVLDRTATEIPLNSNEKNILRREDTIRAEIAAVKCKCDDLKVEKMMHAVSNAMNEATPSSQVKMPCVEASLMWSETSEMHLASDDVSVCRTTFAAR